MGNKIDFFILGAQKSGSTSLFHYFSQHPELIYHHQEEMSYFLNDHEFIRGLEIAFDKYYRHVSKGEFGQKKILAKHAMALYSPKALNRLYDHNPNVKVFLILRDPIKRLYSAYWYARKMGWETNTNFEEALRQEEERLRKGWEDVRNVAYVYNSLYANHVENVLSIFKENAKVITADDLNKRPQEVMDELFRYSGLQSLKINGFVEKNKCSAARSEFVARVFAKIFRNHALKNKLRLILPGTICASARTRLSDLNSKGFSPPPMSASLQVKLNQIFYNDIRKIERITNLDLSNWLK